MRKFDITMCLIYQILEMDVRTAKGAILAQKKFFLLQELGVNIGFEFSWYLEGVHDPDLMIYLNESHNMLVTYPTNHFVINPHADEALARLQLLEDLRIEASHVPCPIPIESYYTIISSILYFGQSETDLKRIYDRLKFCGFHFSHQEFNQLLNAIDTTGFPVTFDIFDRNFLRLDDNIIETRFVI